MGDLDPDSKHDPMFAFDPSGRVIYTKSFSKVMLPGLRLGLAVIPEEMSEIFQQAKHAADIHSPVLMQGALEIYLKNGMFRAHIQRMRQTYSKRGSAPAGLPNSSAALLILYGFAIRILFHDPAGTIKSISIG